MWGLNRSEVGLIKQMRRFSYGPYGFASSFQHHAHPQRGPGALTMAVTSRCLSLAFSKVSVASWESRPWNNSSWQFVEALNDFCWILVNICLVGVYDIFWGAARSQDVFGDNSSRDATDIKWLLHKVIVALAWRHQQPWPGCKMYMDQMLRFTKSAKLDGTLSSESTVARLGSQTKQSHALACILCQFLVHIQYVSQTQLNTDITKYQNIIKTSTLDLRTSQRSLEECPNPRWWS